MSLRSRLLVVALTALFCATSAGAQSLGDVAKKEQQRRKSAKSGKAYTNKDLKQGSPGTPAPPVAPAGQTAGPGGEETAAADKPAANTPDAEQQDPKKTEEYWRKRIETARNEIQRNELFADALQSRINALSNDFVNVDDPAQKASIANARQQALTELERVRNDIDRLKKQLADIEEEARQAGVPPGWLR